MSARSPVVLLAGPGSRRLEALALERAAEVICGPGFDPESSCARRVFRKEHPDLMVAAPERRRRVNPPVFEENDGKETTLPTARTRAVGSVVSLPSFSSKTGGFTRRRLSGAATMRSGCSFRNTRRAQDDSG